MDGLQPTIDINGNNGGWGNWGGALIGGAIGAAFGSGWNNNGRNGNCCGSSCCGDQYIMDNLTTMRTDINSIGRDQLMQAAANASTACQGFSGVNATVERVGAAQALGQSRTESAILTTSYQGQLAAKDNTFAIVSSQKDCCCQTQRLIEQEGCATRQAIHAEGEATRGLMAQLDRERLLGELADTKANLAACQQRQFAEALSLQAQNNIISHVRAIVPATTTPTTAG